MAEVQDTGPAERGWEIADVAGSAGNGDELPVELRLVGHGNGRACVLPSRRHEAAVEGAAEKVAAVPALDQRTGLRRVEERRERHDHSVQRAERRLLPCARQRVVRVRTEIAEGVEVERQEDRVLDLLRTVRGVGG